MHKQQVQTLLYKTHYKQGRLFKTISQFRTGMREHEVANLLWENNLPCVPEIVAIKAKDTYFYTNFVYSFHWSTKFLTRI